MVGVLVRTEENDSQTLGHFTLFDGPRKLFECYTLELPDRGNQRNISRIPSGTYPVKKRYSEKYKNHYQIWDVPNRSYILIHTGNYMTHTRGCVLVGSDVIDINHDGLLDVTNSRRTLDNLLTIAPQEWVLKVY